MLRLLGMVVTVKKKVQMISITSIYNALSNQGYVFLPLISYLWKFQ